MDNYEIYCDDEEWERNIGKGLLSGFDFAYFKYLRGSERGWGLGHIYTV